MMIAKEAYDKLIHAGSAALLFAAALAFALAAERYAIPYLLFFAGWFMRSAWAKTNEVSGRVSGLAQPDGGEGQ